MFIIDHSTDRDLLFPKSHPCNTIPRDYTIQPKETFLAPTMIPRTPRSEWSALIKERKAQKRTVRDLFRQKGMQVLDQNGQGFCWSYSVTMTVMLARLIAGLPPVRLSGHMPACLIKNYRNQGGWCGLSQEFIRDNGVADVDHWKERSMSSANDTPEMRANAKQYKIEQDVVDLTVPVYDRDFDVEIAATLILKWNIPTAMDWAEWSHSVACCDMDEPEPGSFTFDGPNSWGPGGTPDEGWYKIREQAWSNPMGAVATIGVTG